MAASDLTAVVAATHDIWMLTNDLITQALAGHGLTPATFQALWVIDPDESPPSMKVIAARLYCNAPNLTFITNQLVDRGMVERVVDPGNRRSRLLVLTAKGRRVREELVDTAMAKSPFARLTAEELGQLAILLQRTVDAADGELSRRA
ncbi:MarR family winged helix-turn-helix transcriptional regulator [Actinoalloteichus hymeniacidonis]|uniref:Transcriptional regulator n=1 Tax=Actinoalloteichus hymeniacidonis TaxID=340345 RepID=A0AAC9HRY0_9PSEU|nr:MarR family transcriptional regulator [Actinoalloteichus hymeniacidonis]AOS64542.1 transcriptional regulator [Actinoalloteichus hymeniacidonis]MBB5907386.1 DNA-binding MarR family transcriptional regulator [Actinoalloteichus hymeniacidonis]